VRLVQRTLLRTVVVARAALRFSSATGVKRASKRAHLVAAVPGAHRASGVPRRTDVGRRTPPCAGYPTTGPRLHCRLRGRARGSRRTRLMPSGRRGGSSCLHRACMCMQTPCKHDANTMQTRCKHDANTPCTRFEYCKPGCKPETRVMQAPCKPMQARILMTSSITFEL
jgi:hypothetical protein